ncbi:MAG TPA: orotate phosphoribosyltransferase [Chloroflexota bacterium]|nr:orotate phosphoribosyltransferase [Chloroflexota bacterium]
MADLRQQLLDEIKQRAFHFGTFVLSSGVTRDYYIDCRLVTLSARGAWLTGNVVLDTLAGLELDAVGGMTVAADPISTAVALASELRAQPTNAFIVRKEAKGHGLQRQVEGPLKAGDRVAIVDDVLTSGRSVLQAADAVESVGAKVVAVSVLIDRCEDGSARVRERGYELRPVFTIGDFQTFIDEHRGK